jgi:8-oxo-(d)GTP phosphatase
LSEPIRAAGGVVRRRGDLLLVHRPKYGDWTFPKGKAKRSETDEECALREVEEETGLLCRLGRELATTNYRSLLGPKVVRYWEMIPVEGSFRPSNEVDEVRWMSPADARTLLSYKHDAAVLDSLGPEARIVVRHASAGERKDWKGDDRERPLDEKGKAQAEKLVELLEPYRVDRIVSSPFRRCQETVEPLARARGLEIEATEDLADGAGPARVKGLLESLSGSAAVACGHGDEIGSLFGRTKKGAAWILDAKLGATELLKP